MLHRCLPCYICTWYRTTSTCHAIFDTRYRTPILAMLYLLLDIRYQFAMLYLTPDTWHRCLPCYIWHMIPDPSTCHVIFGTWYRISVLAMLYLTLDIWHWYLTCYICHMIYNTWYLAPDTWLLYYLAYAWLLYYYQTSGNHVSPVLLYSCISCTPALVNSTVIPASGRTCLVSGWRGCIPQSC